VTQPTTRREFLQTAAAGAAVLSLAPAVHAGGNDVIKVGLVGCGGRGTGAGHNVLHAAKGVEIVAVGDYFDHKAKGAAKLLTEFAEKDGKVKELGNKCSNPATYAGLDAYKQVINHPGVNYVILATSPGFRPIHLEAAVAAGKNIFTEKPVAVDGPGIRTCLKAYESALSQKLGIAAGTQRRHQTPYQEIMKQIHGGAIGEILAARCYWNGGEIWFHPRKDGVSDLDYLIDNWYHFCWLCGDHIVEQHVHNLDVINWATQSHPERCLGMGGRVRPYHDPKADGQIYNFFAVEYQYPNGLHVQSMCRQITNTDVNVEGGGISEALVGTKGTCYTQDGRRPDHYKINGKAAVSKEVAAGYVDPYVQEHTDLIASIRGGTPINELQNVAYSTLTAIMGRMSAYTGKMVTWDKALNSQERLMPEHLSPTGPIEVSPLPVPGKTRLV
jgi:predicted dehydrogenase